MAGGIVHITRVFCAVKMIIQKAVETVNITKQKKRRILIE